MIPVCISVWDPGRTIFHGPRCFGHINIDLLAKPAVGEYLDFGANNPVLPQELLTLAKGCSVFLRVKTVLHKTLIAGQSGPGITIIADWTKAP